jgi:hypothetical protein
MIARLFQSLRQPGVGPAMTVVALALAVLLSASVVQGHRQKAELDARVAKLARQLNDSGSYWRARAVACEVGGRGGKAGVRPAKGGERDEDAATRLASNPPAGFDVCARMESADAAVLSTLK